MATGTPTSLAAVKVHLRITDSDDDARITTKVNAVNALVAGLPVVQDLAADAAYPATVQEGATLLAARLYRRKNSPSGVEQLGSEGAVYVRRNDPDIAMLLGLGDWATPLVG